MADFKCINLECNNFNNIDIIAEYYVGVENNETVFRDKFKKRIICPVCNQPYVRLQSSTFEGFPANIATFNSKSSQEKKQILKKRADNEFKRNKGMREYKDAAWREEL